MYVSSLTRTIHPSRPCLLVPLPLPDDIEPSNTRNLTLWRVVFETIAKHELPYTSGFDLYSVIFRQAVVHLGGEGREVRTASGYRAREAPHANHSVIHSSTLQEMLWVQFDCVMSGAKDSNLLKKSKKGIKFA